MIPAGSNPATDEKGQRFIAVAAREEKALDCGYKKESGALFIRPGIQLTEGVCVVMNCPKCKVKTLKTFDLAGGIQVDLCESCQGMWFENGEVGQFARFSSDIPNLKQVLAEARNSGCQCPHCGDKELVEVKYSPDSELLVDYCHSCQGTWLDGGEAGELTQLAADPDNMKLRLGRAVFEMRQKMGKTDIKHCPKCRVPSMQPFKTSENVEVDFCGKCKGIWLQKGETADYVESGADLPDLPGVLAVATTTDFSCPDCRSTRLKEMPYAPGQTLMIDRCDSCAGIWLDAGEISTLEDISAELEGAGQKLARTFAQLNKAGYRTL